MERRRKRLSRLVAATVFLLLMNCVSSSEPSAPPAWEAEQQEWEARLHTLESRLLWSQARVRDWQVLAERHRHVSEIACRVQGEHSRQMARSQEGQRPKQHEASKAASRGRGVVAPAKSR